MEIQIKESTLKHMQKWEGINTLSGKSSWWISQSLWFCGNVNHCTCLFPLVFSKHFNYFYLPTIVGELCQIKQTLQNQEHIAHDQALKMGTLPGEFKSDVVSTEFEMLEVLILPCN